MPVSVARMLTRCETTRFAKKNCAEKFFSFDLAPLQSRTLCQSPNFCLGVYIGICCSVCQREVEFVVVFCRLFIGFL